MCGIHGILNQTGEPVNISLLKKMSETIAHRGPDGLGFYHNGSIGLGHVRLAVIDLSSAAHQPMQTRDGRFILVYNGELYNFHELRIELEKLGVQFDSESDTEVFLYSFATWGTGAFTKFNGMFAAAIWDNETQALYLVRDRYGVKPLYWFYQNNQFIFGSEIKAILQHPMVNRNVSFPALNEYFTFQNIFSDLTLFEGIKLLPAGHLLKINFQQAPTLHSYWDYQFKPDYSLTSTDCADRLHHLLNRAVNRQLVAHVPVGTYLSGGIDSGSITAIAIRTIKQLASFTCGFDLSLVAENELTFDERALATNLSKIFDTEHYEIVLQAPDIESSLPKLIWHLEDLRVGQSYPNYYAAKLASDHVKVVLSGTGGDELFAGYSWRYPQINSQASQSEYLQQQYLLWQRLISDKEKKTFFNSDCLLKMDEAHTYHIFKSIYNQWQAPLEAPTDFINASLYFELKTFLHGLLIVEDKLSMAHGLETRVPFLDNDLVEFALKIPASMKLAVQSDNKLTSADKRDNGKLILRQALSKLMPAEVLTRKKQGFSAPDASWFRNKNLNYIHQTLLNKKACLHEFISPNYVRTILDQHASGKINHRLLIWSLLSFEWWCRVFLMKECPNYDSNVFLD